MKKMRVLSLFWHSVEHDNIQSEYLDGTNPTVSMFRDQLNFLVENYSPISTFDFMRIIANKELTCSYAKPPVLLGFDDGFKNVVDLALPIIDEFQVPAMFFVLGEVLKDPGFTPWYVEGKHILRRTERKTLFYGNISSL